MYFSNYRFICFKASTSISFSSPRYATLFPYRQIDEDQELFGINVKVLEEYLDFTCALGESAALQKSFDF